MKILELTPMLESNDLKKTIEFYTKLLGFTCGSVSPDAENPGWCCLQKDGAIIMFSSRNAHSKIAEPTMTGSLYLNIDNVDEVWELLKDKVTIEYPIENFDYGMREFAIRDCNGYIVQFGQDIG
jgi:uncharacterized glyoxalase superfamily protein PhnB